MLLQTEQSSCNKNRVLAKQQSSCEKNNSKHDKKIQGMEERHRNRKGRSARKRHEGAKPFCDKTLKFVGSWKSQCCGYPRIGTAESTWRATVRITPVPCLDKNGDEGLEKAEVFLLHTIVAALAQNNPEKWPNMFCAQENKTLK